MFFFILAVLTGCATVKTPREHNPWSAYLADGARSNYSPDAVALPLNLSWEIDLKSRSMFGAFPPKEPSAPLIVNGSLYVSTGSGALYSLNYETGAVKWAYKAGSQIDSPPVVGYGKICFGSADGVFRCLNEAAGDELWRFAARSAIHLSPLIFKDRVVFTSSDDRIHALDLLTGAKLWTYTRGTFQSVANMPASSPAADDNRVVQLFSDGMLASIDAATGRELWLAKIYNNFKYADKRRTTPLIAMSSIFLLDADGALLTIDAATGAVKSTNKIVKARDFTLFGSNDVITIDAETVLSFNAATGAINWKSEIEGKDALSIMAAGEHVFVISNYKHFTWGIESWSNTWSRIEAFNIKTGAPVWKSVLKDSVGAASFAAGGLYALTDSGFLRLYGRSGCFFCLKELTY